MDLDEEKGVAGVRGTASRRRRWTKEEKLELVREILRGEYSVLVIAKQAGVAASQLFRWKQLYELGGLRQSGSDESLVPACDLRAAMKRIKALERALDRKMLENHILWDAVRCTAGRKMEYVFASIAAGRPVKAVCAVHGVARSNVMRKKSRNRDRGSISAIDA